MAHLRQMDCSLWSPVCSQRNSHRSRSLRHKMSMHVRKRTTLTGFVQLRSSAWVPNACYGKRRAENVLAPFNFMLLQRWQLCSILLFSFIRNVKCFFFFVFKAKRNIEIFGRINSSLMFSLPFLFAGIQVPNEEAHIYRKSFVKSRRWYWPGRRHVSNYHKIVIITLDPVDRAFLLLMSTIKKRIAHE